MDQFKTNPFAKKYKAKLEEREGTRTKALERAKHSETLKAHQRSIPTVLRRKK